MSQTKIITCDCEHPYQDRKYGKQKRVANKLKGGPLTGHRCTVCGKVIK